MCMCGKPTINGELGYSWDGKSSSVRKPDPPELLENEIVLFNEPGRCGGIDSHCHHHTLALNYGRFVLLTRNGSGDHRTRLSNGQAVVDALRQLDSSGRYWILNAIHHAEHAGRRDGTAKATALWRKAAAEKKIKTRKQRNGTGVKVWIESALD